MNKEDNQGSDSSRRDFIFKVAGSTFAFTLVDSMSSGLKAEDINAANSSTTDWDVDCDNGTMTGGYHAFDDYCSVQDPSTGYESRDQSCGHLTQETAPYSSEDQACGAGPYGGPYDIDQNCGNYVDVVSKDPDNTNRWI